MLNIIDSNTSNDFLDESLKSNQKTLETNTINNYTNDDTGTLVAVNMHGKIPLDFIENFTKEETIILTNKQ